MTAVLEVRDLRAGFGSTTVLHGVDFDVAEGTTTALLGLNGAGKSVTLQCVSGLLRAWHGSIRLDGHELTGLEPEDRVRRGLGHVLQARALFPELTVEQNLRVGGATLGRRAWRAAAERVYATFAVLGDRRHQVAGTLSGGEQEMLAVGRALMTSPRLLLVDEPSAGLSPGMIGRLVETLGTVRATGATILLVEQNVSVALRLADEFLVLEKGTVAYRRPTRDLDRDRLAELLGVGPLLHGVLGGSRR